MKQSFPVFLHYDADGYPEPKFVLFSVDMSHIGYVLVNEQTVEVELPEGFDPRATQVDMLRSQIKKVEAEAAKTVTDLQARISNLLCIEQSPAVTVSIFEEADFPF